jgi:hypothetical protein
MTPFGADAGAMHGDEFAAAHARDCTECEQHDVRDDLDSSRQ